MCHIQAVLSRIASADCHELTKIVRAVLDRYRILLPDEEVLFLSLPLEDQEERAEILRKAAKMSDWYK